MKVTHSTPAAPAPGQALPFTRYQVFIIAVLALLQFTIILDFMVLSPLGAQLMPELRITPNQFGWVVSAYAFSAGAAGLLTAGFADRFDRKQLLLFFYAGFGLGTLLCGLAPDYAFLLAARVITGLFAGVIGAVSFAIVTDLFPLQQRGRVMGVVQMAFAVSQVMGIPLSLYLANAWGWQAPFRLIVSVSALVGVAIALFMRPVRAHLHLQGDRSALGHLARILANPHYLKGIAAITLLATGGFMLMPFASAFTVHNLGVPLERLPTLYLVTGVSAMIAGPLAGKLSDRAGAYRVFCGGSVLALALIALYCHLGVSPFWLVVLANVIMSAGITARMIAASTLMTAVAAPGDRGAYLSLQSSVQQLSGGLASVLAGLIVVQTHGGSLQHYDTLGNVVVGTTLLSIGMMYVINRSIRRQVLAPARPPLEHA
jgi:predicted MFS family arabinose efflux permease